MLSVIGNTSRILTFAGLILVSGPSPADSEDGKITADPDVKVELRIVNRKVVGRQLIRVTQGQIVQMVWTTDEETQIHIHGYEIHIPASPEAPAEVTFEAYATGRFPVTSHGFGDEYGKMHQMLLYFEVYPK